jgi:hypothetical protein
MVLQRILWVAVDQNLRVPAAACQELPTCHSHGHRGAASVPHEMQTLQRSAFAFFNRLFAFLWLLLLC